MWRDPSAGALRRMLCISPSWILSEVDADEPRDLMPEDLYFTQQAGTGDYWCKMDQGRNGYFLSSLTDPLMFGWHGPPPCGRCDKKMCEPRPDELLPFRDEVLEPLQLPQLRILGYQVHF